MSAAVLYHSPEEAHRAGIASSNLTELYECRCLPHGGKPGCAEKLGGRQFLGIKAWGEHHQRVSQQHPFPEWATAPEMRYRQKEVRASKRPRHEESLQQLTTARESSSMDYDPLNDQDQDGEQDRAQGSSEANEQEDLEAGADSQQEHESGGEDDAGEDDAGEDDEDEEEQEKEDSEPTEEAEAELPPLPWEEELDAVNQVGRAFQDEEEQEWHRREEEEAEQTSPATTLLPLLLLLLPRAFGANAPPPPPPPPPPRNRKLPPYAEGLTLWYQYLVKHKVTDAAWEDLRALEAARGFVLPSKGVLTREMMKLGRMKVKMYDVCPRGCVLYSDLMHGNEETCPSVANRKRCGAARYRALSEEEKASPNPPKHGPPIEQVPYILIEPLIDALSANPTTAASIYAWNKVTEDRLALAPDQRPHLIHDMNSGRLFETYRTPASNETPPVLLNNFSISLAHSSDSANLIPDRNAQEQVHAYFSIVALACGSIPFRSEHRNVWRSITLGPGHVQDAQSAAMPLVEEMKRLEQPMLRYNGMTGRLEESNVALALEKQDTLESASLSGHRGASAVCSCLWCYRRGCVAGGARVPAFLACEGSTLPDVRLNGITPHPDDRTETEEILMRSFAHTMEVCRQMELLEERGEAAAADEMGKQLGIKNRGAFYELKAYQRGFPIINAADPMHIMHVCYGADVLDLIFGRVDSKLGKPGFPKPISPAQQAIMEANHLCSRELKAPHMGSPVRSLSKIGDWHAWEVRDFITLELGPLVAGLGLDPRLHEWIDLLVKVMQLLERLVPSTEPSHLDNPFDFDSTAIRSDGFDVVPLDVLEVLLNTLLVKGELLFYDRDPGYMVGVLKPSFHRMGHWIIFYAMLGPARNFSQGQMESVIGTDKGKVGSKSAPVANLRRIHYHAALAFLLRLLYDLPELRPPNPKPPPRYTHLDYPHYRFLHNRVPILVSDLPAMDRSAVEAWVTETREAEPEVGQASVKMVKWGRCELPNGEQVRSGLWEKREWLMPMRVERKEGRRKGRAVGDAPNAAELAKDGTAKSARFLFATIDGKQRLVEVGHYLAVCLETEQQGRMLALVDIFPTTLLRGMVVFDRSLPRQRRVIDVRALRCGVSLHLMGEIDGQDMIAVSRKSGRNQVPEML